MPTSSMLTKAAIVIAASVGAGQQWTTTQGSARTERSSEWTEALWVCNSAIPALDIEFPAPQSICAGIAYRYANPSCHHETTHCMRLAVCMSGSLRFFRLCFCFRSYWARFLNSTGRRLTVVLHFISPVGRVVMNFWSAPAFLGSSHLT